MGALSQWLVVLGPAGTVLAVNGAPASWVGLRLDEAEGVAVPLREAAAALVMGVHRDAGPVATVLVPATPPQPDVLVVAVEAVRLVRAPSDLRALLAATMEVMKRQCEAIDVSFEVQVHEGVPARLSFDPDKIGWAMAALVGNALRYVRPGSRRMPGGSIAVRARYDRAAGELSVEIQDDGPGIPAETLPFILRPRDARSRAAGLGLLLVNEVVVAHGGAIELESSTDVFQHGTTVRLRFPAR